MSQSSPLKKVEFFGLMPLSLKPAPTDLVNILASWEQKPFIYLFFLAQMLIEMNKQNLQPKAQPVFKF